MTILAASLVIFILGGVVGADIFRPGISAFEARKAAVLAAGLFLAGSCFLALFFMIMP